MSRENDVEETAQTAESDKISLTEATPNVLHVKNMGILPNTVKPICQKILTIIVSLATIRMCIVYQGSKKIMNHTHDINFLN